ncbi:ATP-dependent DNA helicase PIF1 [Linum perenne]
MGGKVNHSLSQGRGPYVFCISGQIYHSNGSLLPSEGAKPKFGELYIYDTENEVKNRIEAVSNSKDKDSLRFSLVSDLKEMLDAHNILVKTFRYAKERLMDENMQELKIKLFAQRKTDGREYDLPTGDELAALIVNDSGQATYEQDIIVEHQNSRLERISVYHPSLMALQYPLLFPYGEDGWRSDIEVCSRTTDDDSDDILIPPDLMVGKHLGPIQDIVKATYPDILHNYQNAAYLASRAVLAPHHDMVHKVNAHVLSLIPGEEITYLSSDSIDSEKGKQNVIHPEFPNELLNSLQIPGFPDHEIKLKVGVPIILLRNIDQAAGLCNGTRMVVKLLGQWFIEAEIISGSNIGESVFLPRMTLTTEYLSLNIVLSRRQYPVAICFAMTINKSQGQTLKQVGLCLQHQVFSHGQLYVALSRVTTRTGLKILSCDVDGNHLNTMQNIVYKEILA